MTGAACRPGSASAIPRSKVEYLLKNPFYIGQFRWKKRLYKGAHEQIVSRELFDKVQEVFASHGRDRGLYRVHEFAFGSLMRCGECGCTVTAERQRITERLARHVKADSAYFDLGVRLVDVADRAAELYEKYGLLERRGFLA